MHTTGPPSLRARPTPACLEQIVRASNSPHIQALPRSTATPAHDLRKAAQLPRPLSRRTESPECRPTTTATTTTTVS